MLAEGAVDLPTWVGILGFAVLLAGQITNWITLKATQRRTISFEGDPVMKEDFDRHIQANYEAHAQIFSKIGGVERGAQSLVKDTEREAADSRRVLHQSVAHVGERVAKMEAATEMIDRRMAQMDAKLDRIAERIN
jgi:hypothetical protein